MSYKIAEGYVEIKGQVDRQSVKRTAELVTAGVSDEMDTGTAFANQRAAGRKMGSNIGMAGAPNLGHELGAGLEGWADGPDLNKRGSKVGQALGGVLGDAASTGATKSLGSGFSIMGTNPYVVAGVALLGAAIAPVIGGALVSGITLGLGGGLLAVGALVLKDNKLLQKEASKTAESLQKTLTAAAQPLLGPFIQGLKTIRVGFAGLGPQFKEIFAEVAPLVPIIADLAVQFVKNLLPGIKASLPGITAAFTALGEHLPEMATAIGDFFATLTKNPEEVAQITGLLITMADLGIKVLGPLLMMLSDQMLNNAAAWHILQDGVMAAVHWITDVAVPAVTNFFTKTIPDVLSAIGDFFKGIWGWISGIGSDIGDFFTKTIPGWFDALGKWFSDVPGHIMDALEALPGDLANLFQTAMDGILYTIGFTIGAVIGFFRDLPGNIIDAAQSLIEKLSSLWGTVRDESIRIVSEAIAAILTYFHELPGNISDTLSSMWSTISGWFTKSKDSATGATTSMVNTVLGYIRSLPGRSADALSTLGSKIKGAVAGAANWLYQAGKDVINGLIHGITASIAAAIKAVQHAVGEIISGAKRGLGINSPSTVFRDQVGRFLPPGITAGFMAAMPAAKAAIGKAANGLVPSLPSLPGIAVGALGAPQMAMAGASTGSSMSFGDINISVNGASGDGKKIGQEAAASMFEAIERYKRERR